MLACHTPHKHTQDLWPLSRYIQRDCGHFPHLQIIPFNNSGPAAQLCSTRWLHPAAKPPASGPPYRFLPPAFCNPLSLILSPPIVSFILLRDCESSFTAHHPFFLLSIPFILPLGLSPASSRTSILFLDWQP